MPPAVPFSDLLRQGRPLLADGGLGSLFIAQGLPVGRAPEGWVLERPDRIEAAHRAYAQAGSDLLHTVTFGGSAPKLAAADLAGMGRELNRQAVVLARAGVAGTSALIAGDVGPTGLLLPPVGTATELELERAFGEQTEWLADAGVDLLSLETMFHLREAQIALRAARATGLPVLVSLTFQSRPRGYFTMMGDPLIPSLQQLADEGATVVGANCTLEAGLFRGLVAAVLGSLDHPLMVQPNAGQPRWTAAGVVYDAAPEPFARELLALAELGAALVGGCCGTTPEFIAAARRLLDVGWPNDRC